MLDRRIEEKQRQKRDQSGNVRFPASLELPLPVPPPGWERRREAEERKKDEPKRGVIIIDFA